MVRVLIVEDELRMASLIRRGLANEGLAADVAPTGADGLWMAQAHDYDVLVLDVMLPDLSWLRGLPPPARKRRLGAGADADRTGLGRRPRGRARQRRRRLPREAVRVRGAPGTPPRARPPRRSRASRRPGSRRPATRPGDARGDTRREAGVAVGQRVRAAGDVHAPARGRAVAAASTRARLGLRLRQPLERRRRLRAPTAEQDRRAVRAQLAGDGARRWLPAAQRGHRMSRLPIRLRVTAAFALAMAAVLAGSGLFLYLRLSSHLALALDRELQPRSQDLAALVRQPNASLARDSSSRFVERGESYAQLITA